MAGYSTHRSSGHRPQHLGAAAALRDAARLQAGERVMVLGATGGLASAFPGVAKIMNASAVVGAAEPDRAQELATTAVELVADGTVQVPAVRVALDQAAHAHRLLQERSVVGKVVLEI